MTSQNFKNTRERIDEAAWNKVAGISIEIVLFLLSKYAPEIRSAIEKMYGATSSAIVKYLESRFPRTILKIRESETIKKVLLRKKYLIELYKRYIGDKIVTQDNFKRFCEVAFLLFNADERDSIKKVSKI